MVLEWYEDIINDLARSLNKAERVVSEADIALARAQDDRDALRTAYNAMKTLKEREIGI